jgi:hypothetical protein
MPINLRDLESRMFRRISFDISLHDLHLARLVFRSGASSVAYCQSPDSLLGSDSTERHARHSGTVRVSREGTAAFLGCACQCRRLRVTDYLEELEVKQTVWSGCFSGTHVIGDRPIAMFTQHARLSPIFFFFFPCLSWFRIFGFAAPCVHCIGNCLWGGTGDEVIPGLDTVKSCLVTPQMVMANFWAHQARSSYRRWRTEFARHPREGFATIFRKHKVEQQLGRNDSISVSRLLWVLKQQRPRCSLGSETGKSPNDYRCSTLGQAAAIWTPLC